MPPRLPSVACQWRQVADCVSFSASSPATSVLLPYSTSIIPCAATRPAATPPTPSPRRQQQQSRSFSATAAAETRLRRFFWHWIKRHKHVLRESQGQHDQPEPAYIPPGFGRQNKRLPFPLNPQFQSHPVLSEELRNDIWKRVMIQGEPMLSVSAELGVDVRRVAAVVRLKEVEEDWLKKNKPLARPYARAIMGMLPQTFPGTKHEPFNEIPVHTFTTQQLFVPTSESRHFTRADAAEAFNRSMLPADARIPHKELVEMERLVAVEGVAPVEAQAAFRAAAAAKERALAEGKARAAERERGRTTVVRSSRKVEFRFKDYNVDTVGKQGRSRHGVGWRYGAMFLDRKKSQVKIPTEVS
ncbi:hypothetical protein RB597_005561 [Gaeumannomyces tritici]